ncbi:HlyD family efflux transporter periplasmic adaptor subunit [Deltaproteobacteria bacterium PRO3]|nr:HlyD family efflux transporter periplasmic adaptor subunit [Deltaproteobacteria bacterium PRO3]
MRRFHLAIAGLALCLALSACKRSGDDSLLELSGTLEMTEHEVGMPVPGRLAQLLVDEGDAVKRGQLLASLDRFEQARRDYERQVALLARGGGNQQAVEQAELAMEDQRLVAPVDGVVLTKVHETGEVVSSNSPVLVIGDRSRLWVRIYVPEGYVNRLSLGQEARLRFDGLKREFKGKVTFISPAAEFTPRNVQTPEERVTQTFAVKVTLDEVEPYLRPGVAADVALPLRAEGAP